VIVLEGALDGDDGTIDARAVPAGLGKEDGSGAHASHRRRPAPEAAGRGARVTNPPQGGDIHCRCLPVRAMSAGRGRVDPMTQTTPDPGGAGEGAEVTGAPAAGARPPLAATAAQTTAENPWPLRQLSVKVGEYVARMSPLWVEGEIVQLNRRPGAGLSFMTLRDIDVDMSFSVPIREHVLRSLPVEPVPGARVVVHAKPTFWSKRGSLQLEADDIRPVGLGELLARLEQLKRTLAAEGLFAASRKKPLPFLPRVVGLICGRESAAERDVVVNARRRWPAVQFEIREVAVQGVKAVKEVSAALRELDAREEVDVIIISRGGGSLEDLLPFSDEQLTRLVAGATTPIVSAIGHEVDTPLIDLASDVRASTPTDAAKKVVPDIQAEIEQLDLGRTRLRAAIRGRLEREQSALEAMRSRPVLEYPSTILAGRADEIRSRISLARTLIGSRLDRAADEVSHLG